MEETKILNGGLNRDDSFESMGQAEYSDAHNYRSTGTDEQDANYGTNLEATVRVTPPNQRPAGISTSVGTGKFKEVKKAYTMYYNSAGRHQLTEMDYTTLTEKVIFEDLRDTGNVNIFNIKPDTYFNDIKLMHKKYLVMTDGESGMIYCINIDRLKTGGYGAVIEKDSFNLLKAQPLKPIKARYVDDNTRTANLTKGKLFQFRSQYQYDDFAKSSWSTISKRPVPELEMTDTVGDNPSKLNAIELRVNIGNSLVKEIHVASREGLYNWKGIKTVKRDYVLALPNVPLDPANFIVEAYDPTTNEYIFNFYNAGSDEVISALETDEPYDSIPHNAGTLEIINGDILALGDLDEGYDRPTGIDISVTSTQYKPDLEESVNNPRNFTANDTNFRIPNNSERYVTIDFYGVPKTGDKVIITLGSVSNPFPITRVLTYDVKSADNENMTNFINNIFNILPTRQVIRFGDEIYQRTKTVISPTHGRITFVTNEGESIQKVVLNLEQTGSVEGKTLNVVKSNTSYQVALAYYDKFGKYFPIVTDSKYVVDTPSYAISEGLFSQIGIALGGTPPPEAVSYQVLLSENNKYRNNLYVTGVYDAEESGDDFTVINLGSLGRYASTAEGVVVNWDFSVGDRVTLVNTFSGSATPVKWFNNPPLDFAISSIDIKSEDNSGIITTKYLMKIKKSELLNISDILDKEILVELYTPKQNENGLDTKLFFEIGEQYPIVNGQHSVTNITITQADSYVRPRKFRSNIGESGAVYPITVEDFNFSDGYESRFWSAGRGRTYNDEVGRIRRSASIRYSDTFALGTQINNLNRFFANRLYGDSTAETTSVHGAITKLIMRQSYLIALQEFKIAHIPVNRAIIESAESEQSVTISDKLLNNANYVGNYGTGLAKKAITSSDSGNVYFVDVNNGFPCRDGYDGIRKINNKMTKYFSKRLKSVKPSEIVSYYDDFNEEWNVTFTELGSEVKAFSFNALNYEYKDSFEKDVSQVDLIQPDNGTLTVFEGNLLYTPNTDFVGDDSFGISFIENSEVIIKLSCGKVKAGITDVEAYSFIDVYGQDINVLTSSNIISVLGNTIPVPISISIGEYSTDGGLTWTSEDGEVAPNSLVIVRILSASNYGGNASTVLTISNRTAQFNVYNKFGNILKSQAFQRDCGEGISGSSVTYTVPANKYFGETQSEADLKADEDILENGQNFANDPANGGTCPLTKHIWGRIFEEEIQNVSGATYARLVLRTYRGGSATVPPPNLDNPFVCTNPNISVGYYEDNFGTDNTFSVAMNGESSKLLTPPNVPSPVPPKVMIYCPSCGTGGGQLSLWAHFTGKGKNEWALLQTLP